jgi:hypothetical protein
MRKQITAAVVTAASLLLGPAASAATTEVGHDLESVGNDVFDHDQTDQDGEDHDHDGDGKQDHDAEDHGDDEDDKPKPKDR